MVLPLCMADVKKELHDNHLGVDLV
jgi:hypothetical protein